MFGANASRCARNAAISIREGSTQRAMASGNAGAQDGDRRRSIALRAGSPRLTSRSAALARASFRGQRLQFLDERTADLLAHHPIEILRVRPQLFEMRLGQLLMRLRALHEQTEFHRGSSIAAVRAHSCIAASASASGAAMPTAPRRRAALARRCCCQARWIEANAAASPVRGVFQVAGRSGNCSICEGKHRRLDAEVLAVGDRAEHLGDRRLLDTVVRSTSRSPMSCEANRAVPPPSLAEQRKIKRVAAIFHDRVRVALAVSA